MVNLPLLENNLMRIIKLVLITIVLFLALSGIDVFAAGPPGPPGGGGGGDPVCWPPPCVPIDGGLSFLLIAGALYGGKKVYDISKEAE